jgi:hypothetical protein
LFVLTYLFDGKTNTAESTTQDVLGRTFTMQLTADRNQAILHGCILRRTGNTQFYIATNGGEQESRDSTQPQLAENWNHVILPSFLTEVNKKYAILPCCILQGTRITRFYTAASCSGVESRDSSVVFNESKQKTCDFSVIVNESEQELRDSTSPHIAGNKNCAILPRRILQRSRITRFLPNENCGEQELGNSYPTQTVVNRNQAILTRRKRWRTGIRRFLSVDGFFCPAQPAGKGKSLCSGAPAKVAGDVLFFVDLPLHAIAKNDSDSEVSAVAVAGISDKALLNEITLIQSKINLKINELLQKLIRLYKVSFGGFIMDSSSSEPVREIGQELNDMGGFGLMLLVHRQFASMYPVPGMARNLEMIWDGIGRWRG